MKKYILIALSLIFVFTLSACGGKDNSREIVLAPYEENIVAGGIEPDLDNFVPDGIKSEGEIWDGQNALVHENENGKMEFITKFSDLGIYIYMSVYDENGIFLKERGVYRENSGVWFYYGKEPGKYMCDVRLFPEAITGRPFAYKLATYMNGRVNQPETTVLSAELFVSWKQFGFESKPDEIMIYVFYYMHEKGTEDVFYVDTAPTHGANKKTSYHVFDENGYAGLAVKE